MAVGDQAGGEAEEGFVDVVTSLPSNPEAAKTMQSGDGALDHPAEDAQARAVLFAPFGDDRADAALP